ncbi:hypothetical protein FC756_25775 [Lysinibacillus mangiferihumi]|uniref:DUF4183 domain-containing protein n=1 Tax=Lysinibacillus mangiferihumi TaxID=1130819 RepID=A0A4U2XYR8_9BACI|nr:hypothetical protein [Lysinibacillus mangiferihumi]TKI53097.1 hypothetical protein FC756_25775 [Lysinibacillus mangiferihumi]
MVKSATTGVGSVFQVTSPTSDYFLTITSNTGVNAVTTLVAATKAFTISTEIAAGEIVVIDSVAYTAVTHNYFSC